MYSSLLPFLLAFSTCVVALLNHLRLTIAERPSNIFSTKYSHKGDVMASIIAANSGPAPSTSSKSFEGIVD